MFKPTLRSSLRAFGALTFALALHGGDLKIHVINVGWGSSVLVEGPSGKRVLLEAGHSNRVQKVVDYLTNTAKVPAGGIDTVILGHNHADHGSGLPTVWNAGFIAAAPTCYYNGSTNNASLVSTWFASLGKMPTAAAPSLAPLVDLGNGAGIYCIAAKGRTLASGSTASQSSDENDNSMGLLVKYGGFTYLWTSDMGGFEDDGCSGRSSAQADMETPMIQAAVAAGALKSGGVDVLAIGHHGSESSTNPEYVRVAAPSVAVIATGRGQSSSWDLPRTAVVDKVLASTGSGSCTGFAVAPLILQTEDGDRNDQGKRSTTGYAVGNVVVDSDGTQFWISANGDASTVNIADSSSVDMERASAGLTGTPDPRGRAFAVHGGAPAATFTVNLGQSSATLTQGQSATIPVSVGAVNGFTGTVQLSTSPLISGVTSTFTPASVTVPGTATLQLAAGATAPTGTTSTYVTGVSGALQVQAPLSVAVQAAPVATFSLSLGAASVSLVQGGSVSVPVTLTSSGYTGTAALAFSPAMAGVTAAFSPATVTVPGTATLTLSAAATATVATTSATVTATGGTLQKTAGLGVTVQAAPVSTDFAEIEANDALSSANVVPDTAKSLTGYFPSTSDNDDWYQLNLAAGHTLSLSMTGPTASAQDYDLYLTSSTGSQLAASTGSTTTEALTYKNTGTTVKKVYVHVSRYASYSRVTPYKITLTR